jgi:hypothetical protein
MTYLVKDFFTGEQFEIEDLNEARAKLAEIKTAGLAREEYRFTVAKEIINGNDTTWSNANLDTDPEDSHYRVFNTFTGQHELVTSLSQAKARRLEIKEQFISSLNLNDEPELKPEQPISTGAQTL